eukprot:g2940.t1
MMLLLLVMYLLCVGTATGETTSGTVVQLFEWSHLDVEKECAFLSEKGFEAVQVSPPQESIQGSQWWTRYQPVSYQIISRSGDENAFASMVSKCKSQGVDVYVDVVMNHMAQGSGVGIAGTNYGGRSYLNYSADDMHHNDGDDSSNCVVNNY